MHWLHSQTTKGTIMNNDAKVHVILQYESAKVSFALDPDRAALLRVQLELEQVYSQAVCVQMGDRLYLLLTRTASRITDDSQRRNFLVTSDARWPQQKQASDEADYFLEHITDLPMKYAEFYFLFRDTSREQGCWIVRMNKQWEKVPSTLSKAMKVMWESPLRIA